GAGQSPRCKPLELDCESEWRDERQLMFAREREQVDVKDIAPIVQIDGTRLQGQGGTSKTQRPLDRDIQPVKGGKHRTIRLVVDDAARVVELEDRRDAINQNESVEAEGLREGQTRPELPSQAHVEPAHG